MATPTANTARTAKKSATKKAAAEPSLVDTVTEAVSDTVSGASERFEDAFETAVKFARDAAHTYIGVGLVVQERIARRDFTSMMSYGEFVDQAKTKGHDRMVEIRSRVEPYAKMVTDRFEPITARLESTLPKPVKDVVDASRDRVRDLLAV